MTDWDGAGYGRISTLQRTVAAESLAALRLRGFERVLDVGCGDGRLTRRIANRLPDGSVVGIDPSPRMIAAARQRQRERPGSEGNTRFEIGEVTTMRFAREFDLIVSFNALHWVHDQGAAFARMAAALRPSGRMLVQFVCAGPARSVEQVSMSMTDDPRWSAYFHGFRAPFVHVDPEALEPMARAAGLIVEERSVTEKRWDFGSPEAFAQWCAVGSTDWTARLPSTEVDPFIGAVVAAYGESSGSPGVLTFMQLRATLRPGGAS